jgi:hypothetical protein
MTFASFEPFAAFEPFETLAGGHSAGLLLAVTPPGERTYLLCPLHARAQGARPGYAVRVTRLCGPCEMAALEQLAGVR